MHALFVCVPFISYPAGDFMGMLHHSHFRDNKMKRHCISVHTFTAYEYSYSLAKLCKEKRNHTLVNNDRIQYIRGLRVLFKTL